MLLPIANFTLSEASKVSDHFGILHLSFQSFFQALIFIQMSTIVRYILLTKHYI